jgi:hypothetical protein
MLRIANMRMDIGEKMLDIRDSLMILRRNLEGGGN